MLGHTLKLDRSDRGLTVLGGVQKVSAQKNESKPTKIVDCSHILWYNIWRTFDFLTA